MPENIQESDRLYRLLVDSVRDYAIFALDPTGHILTWNPGAQRFKGYTAEEAIGRHFSIFYPAESITAGKPDLELVVAADVGRFEDEGWRLRKDGTRFWANVVITALRDEAGQLIGYAKVTRDLTERVLAERRAVADARQLAEVEAANQAKSEFLRTLSHELRTPLNAIGGYTELLLLGVHGSLTATQRQDLERVRRSQQHLLRLIDELLDFSRVEAGTIEFILERVPLEQVAQDAMAIIESQATVAAVSLELQADEGSVIALADAARVRQILLNLLTNAIRYTAPGHVTVQVAGGAVAEVHVADTGPGIPPDVMDSIFEPFVQLGRTYSTSHQGTGLGLAISRRLARGMNGDLTVASQPGAGTTFTLTLPLAP